MVTAECPWCDEAAQVDDTTTAEFACDGCGIRVEIAPDPVRVLLGRAA